MTHLSTSDSFNLNSSSILNLLSKGLQIHQLLYGDQAQLEEQILGSISLPKLSVEENPNCFSSSNFNYEKTGHRSSLYLNSLPINEFAQLESPLALTARNESPAFPAQNGLIDLDQDLEKFCT